MLSLFRIHDLRFDVQSARLDCFVSRPGPVLKWGLEVRASSTHPDREHWEPKLTSEILFATGPGEIASWLGVAPRKVEWTVPFTAENDPWASLYVFEHEVVCPGQITLSRRGEEMHLHLQGRCDVGWSEPYGRDLELEIEGPISFRGVLCGRDDEEIARADAAPLLNERSLTFERDEYGVTMLRP